MHSQGTCSPDIVHEKRYYNVVNVFASLNNNRNHVASAKIQRSYSVCWSTATAIRPPKIWKLRIMINIFHALEERNTVNTGIFFFSFELVLYSL